ncbi:MAG: CHAT domain-containing protein [Deltaproteobacteria bacterium]|nr:CHAT domain-containing protein [Deltaproteobacteria bacterium]
MKKIFTFITLLLCLQSCAPTIDSMVADGSLKQADVTAMRGDYVEMERLLEAEIGGDLASANFDQLFGLSNCYLNLKKYDKLLKSVDYMDARVAKGDLGKIGALGAAKPHQLRAITYLDLGQFEQAIQESGKAIQIASRYTGQPGANVHISVALGFIGSAHASLGNKEEALQAAASLKRVNVYNPLTAIPEIEKSTALAGIYSAIGDYNEALSAITTAEPAWQRERADFLKMKAMIGDKEGLFDNVIESMSLPRRFIRNRCLLELGRTQEAKQGVEGIFNGRIPLDGYFLWEVLYDRGRISEQEKDWVNAQKYYCDAIEVIEEQRATIHTEMHKIGFAGDKQAVYARLISILLQTQQPRLAFEYAERAKARALVDLLAQKQQFASNQNIPTPVSGSLEKMASLEKALAEDSSARPQAQKAEIKRSLKVIKKEIQESAPQFASLVTVSPISSQQVQAFLGATETVLEYFYHNEDLFMFVVTRDQIRAQKLQVKDLPERIRGLRNLLSSKNENYHAVAGDLYNRLILPAEDTISNSSQVTIVPHGILHYLPFGMLTHSNASLAERVSIRFLPNADVLRYISSTQKNRFSKILVLGNPDLGDPKLDLSGAEKEATDIGRIFSGSTVLTRKRATETAVKQFGPQFQVLHFASHGIFDNTQPLSSALLLASDNVNDGRLTVNELYTMDLNAELITLSACETGLGQLASGDDVVGLTRGFMYAGAKTIVASLWPVSDEATAYLMTSFYQNLKTMPSAAAFRAAQLKTKKKFPNPFYWASFQLIGSGN